jgi:hypothetical protein
MAFVRRCGRGMLYALVLLSEVLDPYGSLVLIVLRGLAGDRSRYFLHRGVAVLQLTS